MPLIMDRFVESTTFGPPSEPISVRDFITAAAESHARVSDILAQLEGKSMLVDEDDVEFEPIPEDLKSTIEAECRYDSQS